MVLEMKRLTRSFLTVGVFFAGGGLISIVGGALAMFRFLRRPDIGDDLPASELFRGVVLPHIFMIVGVGVITYGVVLLVRASIIEKRKAK